MAKRSVAALIAGGLGLLGVFDVILGPVLVELGVVAPMFGFQWFFVLGLFEGVVALLVGLLALWRTRQGQGRRGRPLAWTGVAAGAGLAVLLLISTAPGRGLPPINDITTDLDDPPAFQAALAAPANQGQDLSYPPDFAAEVRAGYPDLEALMVTSDPATTIENARKAALELGWEVVDVNAAAGVLEARETSRVFHFVDDVVVRVRTAPGGTRVDVRSRSRDGRGDLGVNEARIQRFFAALPRS